MDWSDYVVTAYTRDVDNRIRHGHGQHLLITGPPGIGKTSLLQFEMRSLRESGYLVALVPLRDVSAPGELFEHVVREYDRELASRNLSPALRASLTRISSQLETSRRIDDPAIAHRVLEMLQEGSAEFPGVVLMLDGLDEAVEPRRFVTYYEELAQYGDSVFTLVITSRSGYHIERLARSRKFVVFELGTFTPSEMAEYLRRRLADADITASDVEAIIALSQGSPLLLTMLAAYRRETGTLPDFSRGPREVGLRLFDDSVHRFQDDVSRNEAIQLLTLLAVFHPASLTLLADLSGIPLIRVQELLSRLNLVVLDLTVPSTIEFAHVLIHEAAIAKYILPADLHVDELRFGDEAAERDVLLESRFIPRPHLGSILSGEKTVVLGDRGAGKSALFRQIQRIAAQGGSAMPMLQLTPSSHLIVVTSAHPATVLQQLTVGEHSASSADEFKALWLLFAAALAAKTLQGRFMNDGEAGRRLERETRKILESFVWSSAVKRGRLGQVLARLRRVFTAKVKFSVGPLTIEPTVSTGGRDTAGARVDIDEFLERIDDTLSRHGDRLLVLFDQVDEAYKYQRDKQEPMIQGRMLAEAFVSQMRAIRLPVLLRTDLFEIYDIQEKNKFVSRMIRLEWTRQELLEFLVARLCANPGPALLGKLLDRQPSQAAAVDGVLRIIFPESVEGQLFSEWLFRGLRNGTNRVSPRQIILFLNLCRDSAAAQVRIRSREAITPLFSEAHITEAMTRLSELSYEEVVSDFRVATAFVRNCRSGKIRDFELDEVETLFNTDEGSISEQVERLERLGFLERRVIRHNDELVFRFVIPALYTRCWERVALS